MSNIIINFGIHTWQYLMLVPAANNLLIDLFLHVSIFPLNFLKLTVHCTATLFSTLYLIQTQI